jgi:AcrR family transcriptional regulator
MPLDEKRPRSPVASPFLTAHDREATRERKRQALLLAAVRMFNERGYSSTSLDEVAASLGVTKPVIYHYLGNKDRVLFECVRIGLEQLRDAACQARAGGGSGLQRLTSFLQSYAEIIMGDFGACVVRTDDKELSPEIRVQFRALKREIDLTLRSMIEEAAGDGTAQIEDSRMAGFAIAGALNWAAQWHHADGPQSVQEAGAALVRFLSAGIATRTVL